MNVLIKNIAPLALCTGLLIFSCSNPKENTTDTPVDSVGVADSVQNTVEETDIKAVSVDTVLDETARFIAGLPQLRANRFSEIEKDKYWQEYKSAMDSSWNKMYRGRLSKIKSWQASTLSASMNDSLTLFYPFSGPDFLHAYFLYPNAKEYVMAALEPIVEIPALDTLTEKDRDLFLDSLGISLRDIFGKSYFITTHMTKDLKQIKGVLPPIFFFMKRSGLELVTMKFITLDEHGIEKEVDAKTLHWQVTRGVKITFRKPETGELKNVYYFGISISNKGILDRPEFVKFLTQRAPYNTFVKSASYLMQISAFTEIEKIILNQTETLFQDDTGVPYRDFKNRPDWQVQFYGEYVKPVRDFGEEKYQADLDSAYKASKNRQPLPFSLGYHWWTSKQNYMLVKKMPIAIEKK